jgi:hypothetical protein
MFGHVTTRDSYKRFFNIKQNYGRGAIWTTTSDSIVYSYQATANLIKYGCNVNNDGIYCPIDLMNDLTVYIGLRNSTYTN